jgi:hypothetical protein
LGRTGIPGSNDHRSICHRLPDLRATVKVFDAYRAIAFKHDTLNRRVGFPFHTRGAGGMQERMRIIEALARRLDGRLATRVRLPADARPTYRFTQGHPLEAW